MIKLGVHWGVPSLEKVREEYERKSAFHPCLSSYPKAFNPLFKFNFGHLLSHPMYCLHILYRMLEMDFSPSRIVSNCHFSKVLN